MDIPDQFSYTPLLLSNPSLDTNIQNRQSSRAVGSNSIIQNRQSYDVSSYGHLHHWLWSHCIPFSSWRNVGTLLLLHLKHVGPYATSCLYTCSCTSELCRTALYCTATQVALSRTYVAVTLVFVQKNSFQQYMLNKQTRLLAN